MLFPPVFRPLAFASLVWAVSLAPVAAQDQRAKDGWDMLRASLADAGLRVSAEGVTDTERGLVASGVTIRPARGAGSAVLTLPTLTVEPRAGEGFAFIPASGTRLALPGTGEVDFSFSGEVVFDRDADGLRLSPAFDTVEALFEGPFSAMEQDRMTLRVDLTALSGAVTMDLGDQVNMTGEIEVASLMYDQNWQSAMSDGTPDATPASSRDISEIDDLTIRFNIEGMEVLSEGPITLSALFEHGFNLHAEYEAAASRSSSQQDFGGSLVRLDGVGAYSDSSLTLADGALRAQGTALDLEFTGGYGETEGAFSAARIVAGFEMPLVPTDTPQPFSISLISEGMQASEASWMLLGAQTFAEETADLALELVGEGRWLVDLSEADTSASPLEFSEIRLDRLSLRLGQAQFEGSGRFEPDMEAASPDQALAQGQGAFTFTLQGGEQLLERLGREGILPADQAFLARMMIGALATSVGEDQLLSEVTILPGGQVRVNGNPLPF